MSSKDYTSADARETREMDSPPVPPAPLWNRLAARCQGKNLRREFWSFLAVSFLYVSGMFIFFLLYNLYLLDLGFHEDFLGWTAGAVALGTIAGSLPGGWLAQRWGLRKTLLVCLFLVPAISALRAACTSGPLLLSLAFFGGVASALWAVSLPPIVAQLTDVTNRAFGFSLVVGSGIGFGILAGLVGGRLPGWLLLWSAHAVMGGKRAALLFACALAALALWPAWRLKFSNVPVAGSCRYPRNRFVKRFFPALAIWSFATGAFNPFFNAYFAHGLGFPVQRIGTIFASAHVVQVIAVFAAPIVFRRFGVLAGILYTQLACGAALEWLAAGPRLLGVGVAFACFTGFQWMSEPGLYTLLMSKVQPEEQAGASALNLLVISSSQAIAAVIAGQAFARFGYPVAMTVIGAEIFVAAFLFCFCLSGSEANKPAVQAVSEIRQGGVA